MRQVMPIDWVGEVFAAMRECGENISIVFGRKEERTEPRWFELPHDQYDGIGGLAAVLRQEGFAVGRLPVLADDRLTVSRALRGLFAVIPTLGLRRRQWRNFDGRRAVRFLPVGERMAWRLLRADQTRQIAQAAKAAGVTVNTYLLFHLDAPVAARLCQPGSDRRWMIPVNLRGAVRRPREGAPHMAFLAVDMHDGLRLVSLQARIAHLRRQGYHWGAWLALNAGRLTGRRTITKDMRQRERRGHGWTGIFSNLGVWEVPGAAPFIFCPAISKVHPVGAGCITMNGQMALTVQLHEGFGADLATCHDLLDEWTCACLASGPGVQARALDVA